VYEELELATSLIPERKGNLNRAAISLEEKDEIDIKC
jgi:hypothetical protein